MRRALLLVCMAGLLSAGESVARFEEAYRAAREDKAARREAILDLARDESAAALEQLFRLWERLAGDATAARSRLFEQRSKARALRPKLDDPRKRDAIRAQIAVIEEEALATATALAGLESDHGAILEGVGGLQSEEAIGWLTEEGLRRATAPLLLLAVARKVAEARADGAQALLVALDRVRRPELTVTLLDALRRHAKEVCPSMATFLKLLRHREWTVRIAAAHVLARSGAPEAVEPLLAALDAEKGGGETRAQQELGRALTILTGANLGADAELWHRWWQDHAADVQSGKHVLGGGTPGGKGRDAESRFYGIELAEKRIIYVFDKSGSMEVSMENPRWVDGNAVPARDDEDSRFDGARRELLRSTKSLRKGSEYAVILYSDRAEPIHDKLQAATPEFYAAFANEMGRCGPEGSTNIYEAMDFALRMANVHSEGTRGEQRADAIILVSDGSPTNAKGETEDPERTLRAIRGWNAQKRIVIHTIGIGAEHNVSFLKTLAAENEGTYYAVIPKG